MSIDMEEFSTFEKIVHDLGDDERRDLLSRIEQGAKVSREPLSVVQDDKGSRDIEAAYKELSFFQRIFLAIKALFSGKNSRQVFEDDLLVKLKKQISRQIPHLIDVNNSFFLDRMRIELESLAESARFFKKMLDNVFSDNKSEFIAFLVRAECEKISLALEQDTNPRMIIGSRGVQDESDLKNLIERRYKEILRDFPEEEKKRIYLDYQSFSYLKELSDYDFDTILSRFTSSGRANKKACPFSDITKRFVALAEILKSTQMPPSKSGLKALFLYSMNTLGTDDLKVEAYMKQRYSKAEEALSKIRTFNTVIPMDQLAKILMNDFNYSVQGVRRGEDWFVLFKKFWNERITRTYKDYSRELRSTSIVQKAVNYFGGQKAPIIKYYHPSFYQTSLRCAHWRSFAFINGFYQFVYAPKMANSLKILFINGEFYKTDNRIEFTDTYNFFNSLHDKIVLFEKRIHPEGEIGKAIAGVQDEKANGALQEKKTAVLMKKADAEALLIVDKAMSNLQSLNKLLNGVLYSEAGGKYDTISNMSYIGGKENELLKKEWEKCISFAHEAYSILKEMRILEASK
ncbi:MAG: hypothetical protein JW904_06010 [Spirochaetales bacterium]|nr:hypothetical protein [Spirochaetales bacterium]